MMVSVFVLAWSHEKYIEQAIRSVIYQTYRDIEILFLDNHSSDRTFELASDLLENSGIPHKVFKREKPFGIAENLNFLFEQSAGNYLCVLSGDDWLNPASIDERIKAFGSNHLLGLVDSGGYNYYDDLDLYEPIKTLPVKNKNAFADLLQGNYISGIGCMLKRAAIENVGLWDSSIPIEDWDMWIRISMKYEIETIDKPLFYYRKHVKAISNNYDFMYAAKLKVSEKFRSVNPLIDQTRLNCWDTYLAAKVMQNQAFTATFEVLKNFRFNKLYMLLLLKSMVPISLRKKYYVRSLRRRSQSVLEWINEEGGISKTF
jgi:glycosyltransferase involved in cell wall biosynthesis